MSKFNLFFLQQFGSGVFKMRVPDAGEAEAGWASFHISSGSVSG